MILRGRQFKTLDYASEPSAACERKGRQFISVYRPNSVLCGGVANARDAAAHGVALIMKI